MNVPDPRPEVGTRPPVFLRPATSDVSPERKSYAATARPRLRGAHQSAPGAGRQPIAAQGQRAAGRRDGPAQRPPQSREAAPTRQGETPPRVDHRGNDSRPNLPRQLDAVPTEVRRQD